VRPANRPSVGPALIVVGIAFAIVVGGVALSFATGGWGPGSAGAGSAGGGAATVRAPGSALGGVSASRVLAAVASEGQPPAGIRSSLVVPAGARLTGHADHDNGAGTFDRAVTLAVDASPSQVVTFYRALMPRRGWGLLPQGVARAGQSTELFYERAGADGYYWEVSVTVTPVLPSLSPALGGGDQTAPTSRLVLDVVQVADAA
jgi:hypothetical protein